MRRRRASAVVAAPTWVLRAPDTSGFLDRRTAWDPWLAERERRRIAAGMSEHEAAVARLVRDTAWLFAREQAAAWGEPFDREVPAL